MTSKEQYIAGIKAVCHLDMQLQVRVVTVSLDVLARVGKRNKNFGQTKNCSYLL